MRSSLPETTRDLSRRSSEGMKGIHAQTWWSSLCAVIYLLFVYDYADALLITYASSPHGTRPCGFVRVPDTAPYRYEKFSLCQSLAYLIDSGVVPFPTYTCSWCYDRQHGSVAASATGLPAFLSPSLLSQFYPSIFEVVKFGMIFERGEQPRMVPDNRGTALKCLDSW